MKLVGFLLSAALLVVAHAPQAHAYLDPGTGSILLQGILAVVAGTAVTLKLYWAKLKEIFGRPKAGTDPTTGGYE